MISKILVFTELYILLSEGRNTRSLYLKLLYLKDKILIHIMKGEKTKSDYPD